MVILKGICHVFYISINPYKTPKSWRRRRLCRIPYLCHHRKQIVQRILTKIRGSADQLQPFIGKYDRINHNVTESIFLNLIEEYKGYYDFEKTIEVHRVMHPETKDVIKTPLKKINVDLPENRLVKQIIQHYLHETINPILEVWALYPRHDENERNQYFRDHHIRLLELSPGYENEHLIKELNQLIQNLVRRAESVFYCGEQCQSLFAISLCLKNKR